MSSSRAGRGSVRLQAAGALGLAILLICGCPQPPDNGNDNDNTNDNDGTSNDTLRSATSIVLEDDAASFTGSIARSDVDVFSIGQLQRGDRLVVDVAAAGGDLDAVLAIFDNQERAHAFNDDRESDASDLDPRLSITIFATGNYFIGVASFPGANSTGDYRVDITVEPGGGNLDPRPQVVFLNWAGGNNITVPNVGTFDLPRFSANDVGDFGDSETTALKRQVESIVQDRFLGLNLTLLNSDSSPRPTGAHSAVHFGGDNRSAFAIAEQIDVQNQDRSDEAIIFSSSFKDAFAGAPSLAQMATGLGNTIAHEVGHLLGLVHTRECSELMDTTCGNSSILVEQSFAQAPLDDSVFAFGLQDADQLLEFALGLIGQ